MTSASPTLPSKEESFQSSLTDEGYKAMATTRTVVYVGGDARWPCGSSGYSGSLEETARYLGRCGQGVLKATLDNAKNELVLDRALFRCCLTEQSKKLGSRFLDTYLLSKALFPGLDSYQQKDLSYPFLGKIDIAKNPLRGETALQGLYGCWNPAQESVTQCSF
ncbi:unnamed protein product [Boreogadus saida]